MQPNDLIQSETGRTYRLVKVLGTGAQGTAFLAIESGSHVQRVVKAFAPTTDLPTVAARVRWLADAQLGQFAVALGAPLECVAPHVGVGYVMRYFDGVPLSEFLETCVFDLAAALNISASIARAVATLETHGVAHADLDGANVIVVDVAPGVKAAALIDLDGFVAPGVAFGGMFGHDLSVDYGVASRITEPSIKSDRFSLGIVLHLTLQLRHPISAHAPDGISFEDYKRAYLAQVRWYDDPRTRRMPQTAGVPIEVLSPAVHDLFRRALTTDLDSRPSGAEWVVALEDAITHVMECTCGERFVNHASRSCCPTCSSEPGDVVLDVGRRTIPLDSMRKDVGRVDLGGHPEVSRRHASFARFGVGLHVQCLSRNGLVVASSTGERIQLEQGESRYVVDGDVLEFASGVVASVRQLST